MHLTDVLEDRDGSLLVVDTGGWFRIGCPSSLMAKPEVPGAIYRIRPPAGAPAVLAKAWAVPIDRLQMSCQRCLASFRLPDPRWCGGLLRRLQKKVARNRRWRLRCAR